MNADENLISLKHEILYHVARLALKELWKKREITFHMK